MMRLFIQKQNKDKESNENHEFYEKFYDKYWSNGWNAIINLFYNYI